MSPYTGPPSTCGPNGAEYRTHLMLGLGIIPFTLLHVVLSLVGLIAGLVVA